MPYLSWSQSMSVGVPILDSDHKALFRIVNQLHDFSETGASQDDLGIIFGNLVAYIDFHFAREEKVMKACGFPALETHAEEHAEFARFIHDARERYAGIPDPDLTRELLEYLKIWLNSHILIQDMAYKPYVMAVPRIDETKYVVDPGLPRERSRD
jgi:hemerythrin